MFLAVTILLGGVLANLFLPPGLAGLPWAVLWLAGTVFGAWIAVRTQRRWQKRLDAKRTELMDRKANVVIVSAASPDAIRKSAEKYKYLLALPKPRKLVSSGRTLAWGLFWQLVVLAWGVGLVLWSFSREEGTIDWKSFATWILPAFGFLWVYLCVQGAFSLFSQRRLLEKGEIALAKVTDSGRGKRGRWISFVFEDNAGKRREGRAADNTADGLYEDMLVPIFYYREDAEKHVALCGTPYQFDVPEQAGSW